MDDFQLKLLTKRSYQELSKDEKELMNEWCASEEEFHGLKSLFSVVESLRISFNEDMNTKKQLDELFESKYKTSNGFDWRSFLFPKGIIFFRQPSFQLAFGVILILGVSIFYVNQSPVQLAKNEVQKSQTKKSKSEIVKSTDEKTKVVVTDSESNIAMNQQTANNFGIDEIVPPIVPEEKFEMLERPATAVILNDEGVSQTYAMDNLVSEQDMDFKSIPIQPVSSNPSVLDNLFTTY